MNKEAALMLTRQYKETVSAAHEMSKVFQKVDHAANELSRMINSPIDVEAGGRHDVSRATSNLAYQLDTLGYYSTMLRNVIIDVDVTINKKAASDSHIAQSLVRLARELVGWDKRFNFPRSSYIPKDAPDLKQLDTGKDIGLEIWTYSDGKGRMYGIAFAGKANKPLWHYSFRNQQQLDKQVQETIEDRKGHVDTMQQRRQERLEYKHTLKVDDILYSSWGYDQTNLDYYQVVEVGEKSVKIRKIGSKVVRQEQGADYVVAAPNHFIGPPMTKIVRYGDSVSISSYANAYKWDGKPQYETAFGYGH